MVKKKSALKHRAPKKGAFAKPRFKIDVARWGKILLVILVISGIVSSWVFLRNPEHFPLNTIVIQGVHPHVKSTILQQAIASSVTKQGFFTVNISTITRQLSAIPWISTVTIRKIWPDKLIIELYEQDPIARWGEQSLITRQGLIFTPPLNTLPAKLPQLCGPSGQEIKLLNYYQQMNEILAPLGLKVVQLNLTSRMAWDLKLNNQIDITLGRQDPLERLRRLVKVYSQIIGSRANEVVSIDLRYTDSIAVQWKTISTKSITT